MGKQKILPVLLAILLLVSISSVAYARYISKVSNPVQFQYKLTPDLTLVASEGEQEAPKWVRTGNSASLPFAVTCQKKEGISFTLYLVVASDMSQEAMEAAVVTLSTEDVDYIGVPEKIQEGSGLYQQVGDGYVYRFYSDEEEIIWKLGGTEVLQRSFQITASNLGADALLEIFAAQQR